MLNHIVVMGRLTRDPEVRYTQSQVPVASFSIACERDFGRSESGEKQTDFIDCSAWRQTAEFISKYFQKGSMAVVSGRLQSRQWKDREGNNRTSWEIVVDNIYFGESKRSSGENYDGGYNRSSAPASRPSTDSQPAKKDDGWGSIGDDDGELPF